jgi:hypothetical protein
MVCPKDLKKYAVFMSPMVGYCYLTLAGWYCYEFELGGTDVYWPIIVLPPVVFLCLAFFIYRGRVKEGAKLIYGELAAPLLVGFIGFLIISIPLFTSVDGLTSISAGNNDIAHSAGISRYLKEFARSDTVGFLGQIDVFKKSAEKDYFGGSLSTAFASSMLSLEPYQLQSMSLHIFFLFSIFLVYALARDWFRYNRHAAIGITALYGLSPVMYYTIYHGYQGQMIATGLALCMFLVHFEAISNCQKISHYYTYFPLAVLLNWGVSLTYPQMLSFIYAPIAVYLLLVASYKRSRSLALRWIYFVLITLVITFILSPDRAKVLVSSLILKSRANFGWFIPWISPDTFFGLTTMKNLSLQSHTGPMRYILSTPLIIIMALGFVNAYKADGKLFLLAGSSVFVIVIGYIILAFIGRIEGSWGGYKSYKLLSFFLPLVLLSSLMLFRKLEFTLQDQIRDPLPLLLSMLVGCNLYSSYKISTQMSTFHRSVSKDMADLKNIENLSSVQSINILGTDWWDILWQANFVMRKKLYFQTTTYGGYFSSALMGEWDLERLGGAANDILRIVGFDEGETIPVNSTYVLRKAGALRALLGRGWYDSEGGHRWTGKGSDVSSIIFQSPSDNLAIDLRAMYWPLDPNNRISIYLNGDKLVDCFDNRFCYINDMILSRGPNALELRTSSPPAPPGTHDRRRLGYAFTAIVISPAISDTRGRVLSPRRSMSGSCLTLPG